MLDKPQDRQDIVEHCHNEIVKIISDHRLLGCDIILILELIKNSVISQLNERYYVQLQKTTKIPVSIQPHQSTQAEPPDKTKEMSELPKDTETPIPENPPTS